MLTTDVIIMWPGTNATIPSGFTRETSLDGKFAKATANATEPNVTGGSATHTHTSTSHTHTAVSHNHTGDTGTASAAEEAQDDGTGSNTQTNDNHHHDYNISGVSGGSLADAVTYAATSTDPAYYKVIYIKATGFKAVPTSAIVLWNNVSVPSGFGECDGTAGRPDLRNKYLKGADALGDGGTTGGTFNHEHAINHTHTGATHTHSGESGGSSNTSQSQDSTTRMSTPNHTHTISLSANSSETGSAYTGSAGSADTVEPAYKKFMAIQNTGGAAIYKGTIGMWLGSLATIPIGWALCDGTLGTPDMRDKFVKITNTSAELGNTGGSNTHAHAASNSHTHTASGTHTHSGGNTSTYSYVNYGAWGGIGLSRAHYHTVSSVSSNTSSWNATTVEGVAVDGQPEFRTAAYIQFQFAVGGAVLYGLL
jgi:hypothetical protein